MNPDLDLLRDLIKDEAVVTAKQDWHGNSFSLKLNEPNGRDSPGYEMKIRNTPEDTIAIKSDLFPPPQMIFRNNRGECKRADFVIIAMDGRQNWIVYIEMKRGRHGSEGHIKKQLQGSRCFVEYCRIVGRTFWKTPGFLTENDYQQRYVSVKNIGVNKKTSRRTRKRPLHDQPENLLKISSPSPRGICFNDLVKSTN